MNEPAVEPQTSVLEVLESTATKTHKKRACFSARSFFLTAPASPRRNGRQASLANLGLAPAKPPQAELSFASISTGSMTAHSGTKLFLGYGSTPTACPEHFRTTRGRILLDLAHFHASRALPRLAQSIFGQCADAFCSTWRVFSLQKHFRDFPSAFSAFKSIFTPRSERFWRSKVFCRKAKSCVTARCAV